MTSEEMKKLLEEVNVAWGGEPAEVTITDEIELPEDATLYLFTCGDSEASSAVCHSDGTVFVLGDWESSRPETYEEVEDYSWLDVHQRETINLLGLPRYPPFTI